MCNVVPLRLYTRSLLSLQVPAGLFRFPLLSVARPVIFLSHDFTRHISREKDGREGDTNR